MSNARELAELGGSYGTGGFVGMKNRIINGAMMIDQRNAGASVTPTASTYTLDRWLAFTTQSSKYSVQQSSTAASGFIKSLLATSLSAYSVVASDILSFQYRIEGLNVSDFAWGTAAATPISISFWVRSSLTGTFGGSIRNGTGARSYPFTYTINSANTFEYKTVVIAGDTSGTWATDNGIGLILDFGLGVGSTFSGTAGAWASANYASATGATNVVGTNGATFYITGVQLEKGSTATSFDYRPYGTELALCQRYYQQQTGSKYLYSTTGNTKVDGVTLPVRMRAAPTVTKTAGSGIIGTVGVSTAFVDFVEINGAAGSAENRELGFILNCTAEL